MKVGHTDVLVIGGGLAGLRCAIGARRRAGWRCASSRWCPPSVRTRWLPRVACRPASATPCGAGDNEDLHFEDTVRGSDWGCDQLVARMFTHMAPKAVRELAAWGVPWNRVERGSAEAIINGQRVILTERDEAHGLITARDFGGTRKWRTCYTSDGTGHTMLYALGDRAVAESIPVDERCEAIALIHDGGRCQGAVVRDLVSGELSAWLASATVIATGGYGRIYGVSTNAIINEGIGAAIALETGVARLGNMEAVQFHPTAIVPAGILVTEGCRGDGGVLRDVDGHRFMPDYEPEKAELASRDVVSRRMAEHMRRGKGVKGDGPEHLWLDITGLGAAHIDRKLREVRDICHHFLGIDPAREWIPVRPTQHYSMGGIRTDHRGESPTLRGLFACGEAACWDLHGFNRLGGNSVAETVVAGMLVGEYVADHVRDEGLRHPPLAGAGASLHCPRAGRPRGDPRPPGRRGRACHPPRNGSNHDRAGRAVPRRGRPCHRGRNTLTGLLARAGRIGTRNKRRRRQPRTGARLAPAEDAQAGAGGGRGRAGAAREPRRPLPRGLSGAQRPRLAQAHPGELAGGRPAFRIRADRGRGHGTAAGLSGYGTRNIIEHPGTAARLGDTEAQRAALAGAGRDAVQAALLPFEALLPERYRGRNARLGEVGQ